MTLLFVGSVCVHFLVFLCGLCLNIIFVFKVSLLRQTLLKRPLQFCGINSSLCFLQFLKAALKNSQKNGNWLAFQERETSRISTTSTAATQNQADSRSGYATVSGVALLTFSTYCLNKSSFNVCLSKFSVLMCFTGCFFGNLAIQQ